MTPLTIAITVTVVLFVVYAWINGGPKNKRKNDSTVSLAATKKFQAIVENLPEEPITEYFPYSKKKILTPTEATFFLKLQEVYGSNYFIFPQINLDKLIRVHTDRYAYINSINRKSVDFVLVDKQTLETVMVLELDDPTHLRPDRVERDNKVNDLFQRCGIQIAHLDRDFFENEYPKLVEEAIESESSVVSSIMS